MSLEERATCSGQGHGRFRRLVTVRFFIESELLCIFCSFFYDSVGKYERCSSGVVHSTYLLISSVNALSKYNMFLFSFPLELFVVSFAE